jgi:hypothetical protein|tara:strand:- start:1009 stop:1233 length:225 start_codon:yes stop_codon:yes gene_type:complete
MFRGVDWMIDTRIDDTIFYPRNQQVELSEVSKMLKSGSNPLEIGLKYPELFINKGHGIILLYELLNGKTWRFKK